MFLGIQRRICAQYRPFDVVVDVVLCPGGCGRRRRGTERGALAGFVLGMMFDLAAGTPLGSSALAFGLGGLVAGYVGDDHAGSAVVAGCAVRRVGGGGRRGGDPGDQAVDRSGRLDQPRLAVVLPVQAVAAAAVLSPVLIPVGRWMMAVKRKKVEGNPGMMVRHGG